MSEKKSSGVQFESEDQNEKELWSALENLPREAPSMNMRHSFYRELELVTAMRWPERVRNWLGLSDKRGWLTAAACMLVGIGVGQMQSESTGDTPPRLAALEENVAMLNRQLILDRMQDATPGQRLRGVIDAISVVQDDLEITRALLVRATQDRVPSVRSAAIDALGSRLGSATVGDELMALLEDAESPLVQLALVDLVLRNGSSSQLEYLLQLASSDTLHPDLIEHIKKSMGRETV